MFMNVVELGKRVRNAHNFFIVAVGMAAVVVKAVLVTIVVCLCAFAFEFELGLAILALGNNPLDISVLFVGDEFIRINTYFWILPSVVFEHCLEDSDVLDFDVLCFFGWELERTHYLVGFYSWVI